MDLPDRDDHEAALIAMLSTIFEEWRAVLIRDGVVPWEGFRARLEQALRDRLAATFLLIVLLWRGSVDFDDPGGDDSATRAALQWAIEVASGLSKKIVDDVRQRWEQVKRDLAAGRFSPADADAVLSRSRAEAIAVTEITRAHTAGMRYITNRYAAVTGVPLEGFWITERDETVCPICRPLHRKGPEVWRRLFPFGPPAHPNCRCWLSYLTRKNRLQFPTAVA